MLAFFLYMLYFQQKTHVRFHSFSFECENFKLKVKRFDFFGATLETMEKSWKFWKIGYGCLVGGFSPTPLEKYYCSSQIGFHFFKVRGEHKKYLSCHHLVIVRGNYYNTQVRQEGWTRTKLIIYLCEKAVVATFCDSDPVNHICL